MNNHPITQTIQTELNTAASFPLPSKISNNPQAERKGAQVMKMKMKNNEKTNTATNSKKRRLIFKVILVILALVVSGFGQVQSYSDNTSDQTLRSNGRVNPSTLGLEIQVPLASYPGRGGSVPISLSYSSKLWRMNVMGNYQRPSNTETTCYTGVQAKYSEDSASGWTSSLGMAYVEYVGETNIFNDSGFPLDLIGSPCQEGNSTNNNRYYVKRVQVHLPSGESHELRAADAPAYYVQGSTTPDMTGTYYAVDGSNLKFIDNGSGTYRLYLTDGAYYDFASTKTAGSKVNSLIRKAVSYHDVNGNEMTFNAPTTTYPNGYWTDTIGRTIPVPLPLTQPTSTGTVDYYLPGITNPYKLVWKQLKGSTSGDSGLTNFSDALKYTGIQSYPPVYGGSSTVHSEGTLFADGTNVWAFSNGDPIFNPIVLTEIELPNGSKYKFSYNIYGEIDKIIYPTGGEEHLTLGTVGAVDQVSTETPYSVVNRGVTQRDVYENSSATPSTSTFSTGADGTGFKVTSTAPDGTYSVRYLHSGARCESCTDGDWGFNSVLSGMPFDERAYNASNQLLSKKLTTWANTGITVSGSSKTAEWHPRTTKAESVIYDGSNLLSTATTMTYAGTLTDIDNPLNVSETKQYGFSTTVGTLGSLEKSVETDYLSDSGYSGVNLRTLPTETRVKDASGNVKAKSQIFYDESGYGSGYRGLPTTVKSWTDISGNVSVQTHSKYDGYGNVTESTDAKGNVTTVEYSSTYSYAYPTKVTTPVPDSSGTNGSSTAFETTTTYDSTTGLVLTTTDANGQTTTMEYDDDLLRPTKVTPPSSAGITEMIYTDTPGAMSVKTKSKIDSTNYAESTVYADGLGRTIKSEKKDNAGNVFVETNYDNMGRAFKTSNPYRSGDTVVWTQMAFDDWGRVLTVTTPDSAVVTTDYDLSTSGTLATVVTVTDQASKVRRSLTNGLGQLIRVDEPNDSGSLGTLSSPNQATSYAYDTLSNLTTVTQGSQTRTFSYDAASRLKEAVNPESGTIAYTYDDNSNLATKTDARSVVTTYSYDTLNRAKTRSYSDSTPTATYYYDGKGLSSAPSYSKSQLTKVSSSVSESKYTSFDNVGKILTSEQITDSQTYTFGYSYNLGGMLLEETYPSGRVVKNTIDTDASLSKVETKESAGSYATRAESFSYTAAGAVSSMKLGNTKWENAVFNSRLQPTQLGLGTSSTDQSLWKVNYDYGSTDNNGNVKQQTITVPTITAIVQDYNYDSLNRIKDATETVSSSIIWKQTFSYDRYGNRRFDTSGSNTTTIPGGCSTAQCNPTIDTANNRFTTGQGYTYDSSGNLLTDAEGRTFTYDAENKQKTAANSGGTIGTYSFDGDGKRVKKVSPTETTLFVYDASSKMVAEYLLTELTPSTPVTSYLTMDTLGSPRVITDSSGSIISRRDFMPFGEEISTIGGRTSGLGYQVDAVRQKFTSYERDNETNLDYAGARYYSSQHGRYITIDPLQASAVVTVTQSWNRYSYVLNNPLKYTDPSGELPKFTADQTRLFNTYVAKYNADNNKSLTADEVWNKLSQSQQTTFLGVTHALENSTVTTVLKDANGKVVKDENGKKVKVTVSAISLVAGVSEINGGTGDNKNGEQQFRLLVSLTSDAISKVSKSDEFGWSIHGHVFKGGKVIDDNVRTYRQNNGPPSIQFSFVKSNVLEADIDVDYRKYNFPFDTEGHMNSYNSDVSAVGKETDSNGKPLNNLERHNARYGGTNPLSIPTRIIPKQ